jgi:hypothetical protein
MGSGAPAATIATLILRQSMTATRCPPLMDLLNKLHGCSFFSIINLVKGYY